MQDADQIVAECSDLIDKHALDNATAATSFGQGHAGGSAAAAKQGERPVG